MLLKKTLSPLTQPKDRPMAIIGRNPTRTTLVMVLLAALSWGCLYGPQGPGIDLPTCATVERESTGDLEADILGGWSQLPGAVSGDHPVGRFGTTDSVFRVWLFEVDGTGHLWYGANEEDGPHQGEVSFTWQIENGKLIVDDLPPATVDIRSATHLLIEPIDGRPLTQGVGWNRCNPEVPDQTD
jgi:hypothetical protein